MRFFTCLFLLSPWGLLCQTAGISLQSPAYHLVDRLDILGCAPNLMHPEIKPISRRDAAQFALQVDSMARMTNEPALRYLLDDNNEWLPDSIRRIRYRERRGFFRHFFQSPAHFFEVNTPHFKLRANPMFHFSFGRERDDEDPVYQNQRGIELRGEVDKRIFFVTNLVETQARYPRYVAQRVGEYYAVPGAGFFKSFESQLLKAPNGYDFNVATAYAGFQATKHFGLQLGHGKHFIGNGCRSMFLSDFGAPTFFLKFDTRVWKFHYQNLFLELSPVSQVQVPDGTILPKKYAAIHYLNFKIAPRFAVGFFEATIFNRSQQFELQYLNPVIFYRTVEGMLGSPDNALLGADFRWNFLRRFQLYGQFLLDEWVTREVFSGNGWWANKWAMQAGGKIINIFGVKRLDLQVEFNRARPFTYSHEDPFNSYTHYNQMLAHPLGANFSELLFFARWTPLPRLNLRARTLVIRTGENTPTENWGANPLLNYDSRVRDYGNQVGQGVRADIFIFGVDATWALWHNLYFDAGVFHRRKESVDPLRSANTQFVSAGLRLNIWNPNLDF